MHDTHTRRASTANTRRGEQTAAALEANLTNLEGKLDAMLAALEGGAAAASDKTGDDAKGKTDTTKEGQESKKE